MENWNTQNSIKATKESGVQNFISIHNMYVVNLIQFIVLVIQF